MPILHGTEAPGEALRRQARELIDGDRRPSSCRAAIAFLEFLAARGAKALGVSGRRRATRRAPPVSRVADVGDLDDEMDDVLDDGRDGAAMTTKKKTTTPRPDAAAETRAVAVRGASGLAAKAR